jgi:hypothetical protein
MIAGAIASSVMCLHSGRIHYVGSLGAIALRKNGVVQHKADYSRDKPLYRPVSDIHPIGKTT